MAHHANRLLDEVPVHHQMTYNENGMGNYVLDPDTAAHAKREMNRLHERQTLNASAFVTVQGGSRASQPNPESTSEQNHHSVHQGGASSQHKLPGYIHASPKGTIERRWLPSTSRPDPASYSPTSSDIDALEESFLELEIQSSHKGNIGSKSTSENAHTHSSSVTQITRSQTPASSFLQSTSLDNLELHTSTSIEDRLQLVWRE